MVRVSDRDAVVATMDDVTTDSSEGTTCPDCDGTLQVTDGELVCSNCGAVVDEHRIDHGPDWRWFNDDDDETDPSRAAPSDPTRHDDGLGTEIGKTEQPVSARRRRQLSRIITQHSRTRTTRPNSRKELEVVFATKRLANALELPDSGRDRATVVARTAHQARNWCGTPLSAVVAASVYAVCREQEFPLRPQDIVDATRGSVTRRLVVSHGHTIAEIADVELAILTAPDHVPRVASAVNTTEQTTQTAIDLAAAVADQPGWSRSPSGTAAAAVWISGQAHRGGAVDQRTLSEVVDRTPVALRNAVAEFEELGLVDRGCPVTITLDDCRGGDDV